jgi:hypothetical protein
VAWRVWWEDGGALSRLARASLAGRVLLEVMAGRFTYVPHSSRLLDEHDKELTKLPHGVLDAGVPLPFSIPPAALDIYFVNSRLKIT